eukprot:GHVO01066259.1.p1 GENE.GHVO01066259.1~~GHVO01066259.1.p1  ORF type:complete len:171 (+),score=30.67 GHVO01066259.1:77-514(+)
MRQLMITVMTEVPRCPKGFPFIDTITCWGNVGLDNACTSLENAAPNFSVDCPSLSLLCCMLWTPSRRTEDRVYYIRTIIEESANDEKIVVRRSGLGLIETLADAISTIASVIGMDDDAARQPSIASSTKQSLVDICICGQSLSKV